jgi:putative pyruvate formate lyase activating enzyme
MVLPGGLSQTPQVLRWIAEQLGRETYVSVMAQYFPAHEAVSDDELCRGITSEEYEAALDAADALGLENGWRQELDSD